MYNIIIGITSHVYHTDHPSSQSIAVIIIIMKVISIDGSRWRVDLDIPKASKSLKIELFLKIFSFVINIVRINVGY